MAEEKKLPTKCPTAKKRDIQNLKKKQCNRTFKSQLHTATRSFEKKIKEKDMDAAKAELNLIFSLTDKGVKKGFYKLNKASRIKSRYTSLISSAETV